MILVQFCNLDACSHTHGKDETEVLMNRRALLEEIRRKKKREREKKKAWPCLDRAVESTLAVVRWIS